MTHLRHEIVEPKRQGWQSDDAGAVLIVLACTAHRPAILPPGTPPHDINGAHSRIGHAQCLVQALDCNDFASLGCLSSVLLQRFAYLVQTLDQPVDRGIELRTGLLLAKLVHHVRPPTKSTDFVNLNVPHQSSP